MSRARSSNDTRNADAKADEIHTNKNDGEASSDKREIIGKHAGRAAGASGTTREEHLERRHKGRDVGMVVDIMMGPKSHPMIIELEVARMIK